MQTPTLQHDNSNADAIDATAEAGTDALPFHLCNGSAVEARIIADDDLDAPSWDRMVILALGDIDAGGDQQMVAGLTLTSREADALAQLLMDAAEAVDSGRPLPVYDPAGEPITGRG